MSTNDHEKLSVLLPVRLWSQVMREARLTDKLVQHIVIDALKAYLKCQKAKVKQ